MEIAFTIVVGFFLVASAIALYLFVFSRNDDDKNGPNDTA